MSSRLHWHECKHISRWCTSPSSQRGHLSVSSSECLVTFTFTVIQFTNRQVKPTTWMEKSVNEVHITVKDRIKIRQDDEQCTEQVHKERDLSAVIECQDSSQEPSSLIVSMWSKAWTCQQSPDRQYHRNRPRQVHKPRQKKRKKEKVIVRVTPCCKTWRHYGRIRRPLIGSQITKGEFN